MDKQITNIAKTWLAVALLALTGVAGASIGSTEVWWENGDVFDSFSSVEMDVPGKIISDNFTIKPNQRPDILYVTLEQSIQIDLVRLGVQFFGSGAKKDLDLGPPRGIVQSGTPGVPLGPEFDALPLVTGVEIDPTGSVFSPAFELVTYRIDLRPQALPFAAFPPDEVFWFSLTAQAILEGTRGTPAPQQSVFWLATNHSTTGIPLQDAALTPFAALDNNNGFFDPVSDDYVFAFATVPVTGTLPLLALLLPGLLLVRRRAS